MELTKIDNEKYDLCLSLELFNIMIKNLKLTIPYIGPYEYDTRLGVPYEYGLKMIEEFEEFMKKEGIEV